MLTPHPVISVRALSSTVQGRSLNLLAESLWMLTLCARSQEKKQLRSRKNKWRKRKYTVNLSWATALSLFLQWGTGQAAVWLRVCWLTGGGVWYCLLQLRGFKPSLRQWSRLYPPSGPVPPWELGSRACCSPSRTACNWAELPLLELSLRYWHDLQVRWGCSHLNPEHLLNPLVSGVKFVHPITPHKILVQQKQMHWWNVSFRQVQIKHSHLHISNLHVTQITKEVKVTIIIIKWIIVDTR